MPICHHHVIDRTQKSLPQRNRCPFKFWLIDGIYLFYCSLCVWAKIRVSISINIEQSRWSYNCVLSLFMRKYSCSVFYCAQLCFVPRPSPKCSYWHHSFSLYCIYFHIKSSCSSVSVYLLSIVNKHSLFSFWNTLELSNVSFLNAIDWIFSLSLTPPLFVYLPHKNTLVPPNPQHGRWLLILKVFIPVLVILKINIWMKFKKRYDCQRQWHICESLQEHDSPYGRTSQEGFLGRKLTLLTHCLDLCHLLRCHFM